MTGDVGRRMTNSKATRPGGRVSYLGEGTLRENTGIEVSTMRRAKLAAEGDGGLGRWMEQDVAAGGETYINRHVFPQAPSPTMTSFRRSSAILIVVLGFEKRWK